MLANTGPEIGFSFEKIAPFLSDPLILIGFFVFLAFLIARLIIRSGLIPVLGSGEGFTILRIILRYGFILGLVIIVLGFLIKYRELSGKDKPTTVGTLVLNNQGGVVGAVNVHVGNAEADQELSATIGADNNVIISGNRQIIENLEITCVPFVAAKIFFNVGSGALYGPHLNLFSGIPFFVMDSDKGPTLTKIYLNDFFKAVTSLREAFIAKTLQMGRESEIEPTVGLIAKYDNRYSTNRVAFFLVERTDSRKIPKYSVRKVNRKDFEEDVDVEFAKDMRFTAELTAAAVFERYKKLLNDMGAPADDIFAEKRPALKDERDDYVPFDIGPPIKILIPPSADSDKSGSKKEGEVPALTNGSEVKRGMTPPR